MTVAPHRATERGLLAAWWGVPPKEWLALALLAAGTLHVWFFWGTERTGLFKDDTAHYARLAESLWEPARLPYTFRVLTPWVASILPFDIVTSFTSIAVVALIATVLLLNAYLALLDVGPSVRWPVCAIFLVSGAVVRSLTTPMYVDPLTYALLMLGLIAIHLRNTPLFLGAVTIGVLNRETALFLLPVYLASRWPLAGRRELLRMALVWLTPATVLASVIVVKLAVVASVHPDALGAIFRYSGAAQRIPRLGDVMDLYSVFGALWLVVALRLRQGIRLYAPLMIYAGLVVAQLAISRGDESRNLSHMFPAVLVLLALELHGLRERALGGLSGWRLTMLTVLAAAASMVHFRWTFLEPDMVRYVLVVAGTVIFSAIVLLARRPPRGPLGSPTPQHAQRGTRRRDARRHASTNEDRKQRIERIAVSGHVAHQEGRRDDQRQGGQRNQERHPPGRPHDCAKQGQRHQRHQPGAVLRGLEDAKDRFRGRLLTALRSRGRCQRMGNGGIGLPGLAQVAIHSAVPVKAQSLHFAEEQGARLLRGALQVAIGLAGNDLQHDLAECTIRLDRRHAQRIL